MRPEARIRPPVRPGVAIVVVVLSTLAALSAHSTAHRRGPSFDRVQPLNTAGGCHPVAADRSVADNGGDWGSRGYDSE